MLENRQRPDSVCCWRALVEQMRAHRWGINPATISGRDWLMASSNSEGHWAATSRLMYIALGLWAFFSFFIHFFVNSLNAIVIFGFPLGFWFAAQGSLVAFVVILFWFARKQDDIDREFGMAEED
jgi:putative solute:sodium symporter small subunit